MSNISYDSSSGFYYFFCPFCDIQIQVHQNDICCKMFVCGKINNNPVNPHMSKEEAEQVRKTQNIIGCLNPFYFDGNTLSKRNYG